jgi:hypothetical protein
VGELLEAVWSAQPQLKELELCMTEVQDNLIKPITSMIDVVILVEPQH